MELVYKKYMQYIASLGKLTSSQYRCLLFLNSDKYTQTDLARKLKTDRANINRALELLKELELIEVVENNSVQKSRVYYKAVSPERIIENMDLNNKKLLESAVAKFNAKNNTNYMIGHVSNGIKQFDMVQMQKILANINGEPVNVKMLIGKSSYIVKIIWTNGENGEGKVDFCMVPENEYDNSFNHKVK